jgi:hypothetical protein
MRLKRSRQNIVSINNYNIDGSTLEEVEHDPYLGVELGNDLFIEVPPKECQNANCFGGSLVNVVVPVEVIP